MIFSGNSVKAFRLSKGILKALLKVNLGQAKSSDFAGREGIVNPWRIDKFCKFSKTEQDGL